MLSPCKDCKSRRMGCHDDVDYCPNNYAGFKAFNTKKNADKLAFNNNLFSRLDVRERSIQKKQPKKKGGFQ